MNWIVTKYKSEWSLYDKESKAYVLFGTKKSMEARAKELNSTDVKKHAKGSTVEGGFDENAYHLEERAKKQLGVGIGISDINKALKRYENENSQNAVYQSNKLRQLKSEMEALILHYEDESKHAKGSTIRDTQNSMANKEHRAYKKKRDIVNEMESKEFNKPRKKERDYVNEMESVDFNRKKTKKQITAEKEALARYDKWKLEQPKPFTYSIGGL